MRHFLLLAAAYGAELNTLNVRCTCSSLGCHYNPDLQAYLTTHENLKGIKECVAAADRSASPEQRPYIGSGRRRPDITPFGSIDFIERIVETAHGNIYVAEIGASSEVPAKRKFKDDSAQIIVKYANDCLERVMGSSTEHSLVHEFAMLSLLNNTNITPKAYYISPASVLNFPLPREGTYIGSFLRNHPSRCAAAKTNIRFIVEERLGINLSTYISRLSRSHPDLYTSARFTKQIIEIIQQSLRNLKTVHSFGITHGDIHNGNIVFRTKEDVSIEDSDVVLIDFERAHYFPSSFGRRQGEYRLPYWLSQKPLSVWQLNEEFPGPRDDVYRLIMLLAECLSRGRFEAGSNHLFNLNVSLAGNPPKTSHEYRRVIKDVALYIRNDVPWFRRSIALGSVAVITTDNSIPQNRQETILSLLSQLEQHVKTGYPRYDTRIEYDYIDSVLEVIASLL